MLIRRSRRAPAARPPEKDTDPLGEAARARLARIVDTSEERAARPAGETRKPPARDGEAGEGPEARSAQTRPMVLKTPLKSPMSAPLDPGQGGACARPCARRALKAVFEGAKLVEITGRAGSGMAALVDHIRRADPDTPQVVLSVTAQAAMGASGQTVNSFFGFPNTFLDDDALRARRGDRTWEEVRRIVITQISMLRADVLDAIDVRLRRAKGEDTPFGGVQIVLVGDYFLTPPALSERDRRMLAKSGYEGRFAFSSKVFSRVKVTRVRMDPLMGQRDAQFAAILAGLRQSPADAQAVVTLNERCMHPHRAGATPTILAGAPAAANGYNAGWLAALPDAACTFVAEAKGEFDPARDKPPAPEGLTLKTGARVMALKSDPEGRWAEGALGVVAGIEHETVKVRFDGARHVCPVRRARWDKVRYEWDEDRRRIVPSAIGSFEQIPLRPAWALTVDMAHRLSLEEVRIDIGEGAFAPGQAYVAVSRARSLGGLSLVRPLTVADFYIDPILAEYDARIAGLTDAAPAGAETARRPLREDPPDEAMQLPLGVQMWG